MLYLYDSDLDLTMHVVLFLLRVHACLHLSGDYLVNTQPFKI